MNESKCRVLGSLVEGELRAVCPAEWRVAAIVSDRLGDTLAAGAVLLDLPGVVAVQEI